MTHHGPAGHHGAPGHAHAHDAAPQDDELAQILDLDAELFADHLAATTRRIADLATGGVRHVVDLGAGSGTGTFALLERFPEARVTAVDSSATMLDRLTRTAVARGLAARVQPLRADAGQPLPGIDAADLVWASASLHHLDDPAAALKGLFTTVRPGGLLAVAELDGMPRFLPDDAVPDRPGLEARCRAALTALQTEHVPHMGSDWRGTLEAAGFAVEYAHTEELRLDARTPSPAGAGQYAYLALRRIREAVDGLVDATDLAALDTLLDGGAQDVRHRGDLDVRSTRELFLARRPADTGR
ncbi:class I SAM-dependent methyltransferase [Streptomyces sp. NPDC049813]|uniref:class I SAM-dependent methyltransferase n=1 Tax=Streptomyces sp. NPDC049813 TaxID=3365597 RepID=UPI00379B1A8B